LPVELPCEDVAVAGGSDADRRDRVVPGEAGMAEQGERHPPRMADCEVAPGERKRHQVCGTPRQRQARHAPDDGVIAGNVDPAIVEEKGVGERRESADGLGVVRRDRLVGTVARRHHERRHARAA